MLQRNLFLLTIIFSLSYFNLFSSCCLNIGSITSLPSGSSRPTSAAFSPDGKYLVVANSGSNDVTLFINTSGTLNSPVSYPLPSGSTSPIAIAFSSDGSYVATANYNDVTLFTIKNGALDAGISYNLPSTLSNCQGLAFSPDSAYLVVSTSPNNFVVYDVSSGALSTGISYQAQSGDYPQYITFTSDGHYFVTSNQDGLTIYQFVNGIPQNSTGYSNNYEGSVQLAFSPDNAYLAVPEGIRGTQIAIAKFSQGILNAPVMYSTNGSYPYGVAFSPNGNCLVADGEQGDVSLFTVGNGALIDPFLISSPSISSNTGNGKVIFSPDGKLVVIVGHHDTAVEILTSCGTVTTGTVTTGAVKNSNTGTTTVNGIATASTSDSLALEVNKFWLGPALPLVLQVLRKVI